MEIPYIRKGGSRVASAIHHPRTDDIDLATVLRTLGDPARLDIVRLLGESGELNCSEVQDTLGLPVSTCSYHLRLLREAGVTRTRASGTVRYMSLRQDDLDSRWPGLLDALSAEPGERALAGAPAAASE
jgi:DNA-binding transcriptional ArsR family regulator